MLKLRITVGLALVVGTLTAIIGLFQEVRPLTVFYRSLTSMLIFGIGSYIICGIIEPSIMTLLATLKPKGQKVDIINRDALINMEEIIEQSHPDTEFSPFTPENFDRISDNNQ